MKAYKQLLMRNFFTFLLLLCGVAGTAQQYNNEWIKFDQTYYKFKVGAGGVYRIPKTVLDNAGIGNTPVENLELWNNGTLIPFHSSVSSGVLPDGGYLEFWAQINDGRADKPMYRSAASQHTDKVSLITDTAAYYLSVNTNQSGFRYTQMTNDPDGSGLPVEPYFMFTAGAYFRTQLNPGFAAVVGEYVYSSSFDKGEYWSSRHITPSTPLGHPITNLFTYAGSAQSYLKFGASGNALNARTVRVSLNGSLLKDTVMDYFNDINTTVPFATSLIASNTATIQMNDVSAVSTDRIVCSYYELIYPRQFNFGNATNFAFDLPAKPAGYHLEITNFNSGGAAPVLYDLTTGKRYTANTSVAGKFRFALPGSVSKTSFILASQAAGNIRSVTSLQSKQFTNYALAANQGDYLIISHPLLYGGTTGNNPVNDFAAYRQSPVGGGYRTLVIKSEDLEDQFAFGIKKHPLGIKNFLSFSRSHFAVKPKFVFLIGHGMSYPEYRRNESNATADVLNLVPTFGFPASDNLLSAEGVLSPVPETPIGRLSVVSPSEIEDYLEKLKEYENVQQTSPNTIAGRQWMKNVVHVTGGSDSYLGTVLCNFMNVYRGIIADTLYGANTFSFCKTTTNPVDQSATERLAELFKEGVSILNYFGHSSSTTLEFNLDNPQAYDNEGKYPIFFVNGCNAGNFFTYYPQRLLVNETLSEKFVLAKRRGAIGFVASTHFGIVNYLNLYLNGLYNTIANDDAQSLGETLQHGVQSMSTAAGPIDFYARLHAEQITVHGDPALKLNKSSKADYTIEESLININPSFISVAENQFEVKIKMINLGKAIPDSVVLQVNRTYPDGTQELLYKARVKPVLFADSLTLIVPIQAIRDKGMNKITVTLDPDNEIQEISEQNNIAAKEIFIFEDEVRGVYPYDHAIINDPAQKLYASTANPFTPHSQFIMEIDTTAKFNSSVKAFKTVSSVGGVIEFEPGITYQDSVVYHWRVAKIPTGGNAYIWHHSSFMFIPGNQEGFNQSDYYQHKNSETERIKLDSATREWQFADRSNNVFARNAVFPTAGSDAGDFVVSINSADNIRSVCGISGIIFNVFDPITLKPWLNGESGSPGKYGSDPICGPDRKYSFQFNILDRNKRKAAVDMLDLIPDGHLVVVRNISGNAHNSNTYASQWMADTTFFGKDNSLYHRLITQGFTSIDSFNRPRAFIFAYRKNQQTKFQPKFVFSAGINDRISMSTDFINSDTLGYITSPKFGPAKAWKEVLWGGEDKEAAQNDNPTLEIVGLDDNNNEYVLFTAGKNEKRIDISSVDAQQYPYIKLRMRNVDSVSLTPYQLKYWRLFYEPVPEGAVAPNLYISSKDTLEPGQPFKFGVAFKNITKMLFDSMDVRVTILDNNNVEHVVDVPKLRPISGQDSVKLEFDIDTKNYIGHNTLFVNFNPLPGQKEQHRFNNFLYHNFAVGIDNKNPVMDVTFDGVHILNRDIVSARPHIKINIKDESKFNLMNDTSLSVVQIRYPNGTLRTFNYDSDTLRFIPASDGDDNTASIDFRPAFLEQINPEGDEYELIVTGKDKSGNRAGKTEFRVTFKVISKPMISNLLNYPNPFSTSTAFVFTLTGSEIPQNMKIQILTVTGKIVREITMNELGPIRLGRNITEFKWNGTDQYGQKLANGVYLYRVVTSLNGKSMDKFKAEGDATDKFFNNGYGKMYLMR